MKIISLKISDNEERIINELMKRNNYKSKSDTIRNCIMIASNIENINAFLDEENRKINRISHNVFITQKLLEQFFANNGFRKNMDVREDKCLNEFF